MVAFEFFSRCVACISYIDIACVVAVAEYLSEGGWWCPPNGGSIYFTRCLVLDFTNSHDFILVIVHFDDKNFCLWWDFFVRYFSRCAVDTFQWALVDVFVGLLVCGHPCLIFLPCFVIESCAGEEGGRLGGGKQFFCYY